MYLHRLLWPMVEVYVKQVSCNNSHVFIVFGAGIWMTVHLLTVTKNILSVKTMLLLICGAVFFFRLALKGLNEKPNLCWLYFWLNMKIYASGHWDNNLRISINTHFWYEPKLGQDSFGFSLFLWVNTGGILSPRKLAFGHNPASLLKLCTVWFVYNLARGYQSDSWC